MFSRNIVKKKSHFRFSSQLALEYAQANFTPNEPHSEVCFSSYSSFLTLNVKSSNTRRTRILVEEMIKKNQYSKAIFVLSAYRRIFRDKLALPYDEVYFWYEGIRCATYLKDVELLSIWLQGIF